MWKRGCGPATPGHTSQVDRICLKSFRILFLGHKQHDANRISKIYQNLIIARNGRGPASPLNVPGKFSKIIHGHMLLDAKRFLKKCPLSIKFLKTLFFPKNGCGPATPLRVTQHVWKNWYILSDHKLLDAKAILEKYPTLVAFLSNFNSCQKMGVALPRPSGWPNMPEKFWTFLLVISYSMLKEFWKIISYSMQEDFLK